MKKLLFLLLLLPSLSWGQDTMVARMNPYVLGAGTVAAASCTVDNDTAIFDDTALTWAANVAYLTTNANARKFVLGAEYTITMYKVELTDVNGTGGVIFQLYTDSSNSVGDAIADTAVEVLASAIPDSASMALLILFLLPLKCYLLAHIGYGVCLTGLAPLLPGLMFLNRQAEKE